MKGEGRGREGDREGGRGGGRGVKEEAREGRWSEKGREVWSEVARKRREGGRGGS